MKGRPWFVRMGFAVAGIAACWRREQSFRLHVALAAAALAMLAALRPAPAWWALFALAAALVTALELVNAALEALIDHLHPAIHPEVKAVKDMLSGAVMLAGAGALAVLVAFVAMLAVGRGGAGGWMG